MTGKYRASEDCMHSLNLASYCSRDLVLLSTASGSYRLGSGGVKLYAENPISMAIFWPEIRLGLLTRKWISLVFFLGPSRLQWDAVDAQIVTIGAWETRASRRWSVTGAGGS
jgi:hypothetical protein